MSSHHKSKSLAQRLINHLVVLVSLIFMVDGQRKKRFKTRVSQLLAQPRGKERVAVMLFLTLWPLIFKVDCPLIVHGRLDDEKLQKYFPHIDLTQLKWRDWVRIPLQLVWLLLARFRLDDIPEKPANIPLKTRIKQRLDRYPKLSRINRKRNENLDRFGKKVAGSKRLKNVLLKLENHSIWHKRFIRNTVGVLACALAILVITTPFDTAAQVLFLFMMWGLAAWVARIPGKIAVLVLVTLSVIVSTRYIYWRMTETLNWDDMIDLTLGFGLLSAELYIWIIMVFGYFQTAWPLKRKPVPLPNDTNTWPAVDIFIPTYNEPLSVVKPTVFAATSVDWPEDKINIYILDDGGREEFARFAETAGVKYIAREQHNHAKAGNINHALTVTEGEYVAIFDCDHIPTRSFLQTCMGWFLRDKTLALIQTPHHFFSPDPFERNLKNFRQVPNEGELFYGLIQDGNDLWDATFFCGSCAILKRKPLEEVGGVAIETVTEDAHTSLKLHDRGYSSAYINIPQAAGLATESLAAHVGQRIRWARGMAQIFRLDNPLIKRGLTWSQRICYSNAMMHFLYGIPRIIFLTAPLAFLLTHSYTIYASGVTIIIYALPHIIHSNITNIRMQGNLRNAFWAEMYETVLAWYILRPTTVALIDPSKGSFNVTEKGGFNDKDYLDWRISTPYLLLVGLNIAGLIAGIFRFYYGPENEISTVFINEVWCLYNLLVLGGAVSVATELKQESSAHKVEFPMPACLTLSDDKSVRCKMLGYSEEGVSLQVENASFIELQEMVYITLHQGIREYAFKAYVSHINGDKVSIEFRDLTPQEEKEFVLCTFARADAWVSWRKDRKTETAMHSMGEVIMIGLQGYVKIVKHIAPAFKKPIGYTQRAGRFLAMYLPTTPRPYGES